jgi:hypothetical protein
VRRRSIAVALSLLVLAAVVTTTLTGLGASATSSPFPATIKAHLWNPKPGVMGPNLPFGARVILRGPQSRICEDVAVAGVEWSVWCDLAAQFPVVSTDGGRQWRVAGPLVASDWAGGSMFYVSKVTAYSAEVVAMTGAGVTDTTFDGGRTWFQFATSLSMVGAWKMSIVRYEGGTGAKPYELVMHIIDTANGGTLRSGSATYITLNEGRTWVRLSELVR